jgi:hypothetical protein
LRFITLNYKDIKTIFTFKYITQKRLKKAINFK